MKFGTTTKLYLSSIVFLCITLLSCVNNEDEPTVIPPPLREPIELTKENIAGTWEVYYYSKRVVEDRVNGRDTEYRFTEEDGFSVTFKENGTYYEQNVFGDITQNGKYTIGKQAPESVKADQIKLDYKSPYTGGDTVNLVYVPGLFPESFSSYNSYWGTTDNANIFKVRDIRYYRNIKVAPDYVDNAFNKRKITQEELIGNGRENWEFYQYDYKIDRESYSVDISTNPSRIPEMLKNKADKFGEQYMFFIENDSLKFYQFTANRLDSANMKGIVDIIDDVINFKWEGWKKEKKKDDNGNETVEINWVKMSFKWWITGVKTINNTVVLEDYDRYRNIKDALQDITESAYYRKVKYEVAAAKRAFSPFSAPQSTQHIPVKAVAD